VNGRIIDLATPEQRLAALVRTVLIRDLRLDGEHDAKPHPYPLRPDYADLSAAIRVVLRRELLLVRIDEASRPDSPGRLQSLRSELVESEIEIERQFPRIPKA
jgi:hypothetical protein